MQSRVLYREWHVANTHINTPDKPNLFSFFFFFFGMKIWGITIFTLEMGDRLIQLVSSYVKVNFYTFDLERVRLFSQLSAEGPLGRSAYAICRETSP